MLKIRDSDITIDVKNRQVIKDVPFDYNQFTVLNGVRYNDLLDTRVIKEFYGSFVDGNMREYYRLVNCLAKCLCPNVLDKNQIIIFYGGENSGMNTCVKSLVTVLGQDNVCSFLYPRTEFDFMTSKLLVLPSANFSGLSIITNCIDNIHNKHKKKLLIGRDHNGTKQKEMQYNCSLIITTKTDPKSLPKEIYDKAEIFEFKEDFQKCKENDEFVKNILNMREHLLTHLISRLLSLDELDSDDESDEEGVRIVI